MSDRPQIAHGTAVADEYSVLGHRMRGNARAAAEAGKPSYFDVPLISQVKDDLWQGGCIPGLTLPDDFDFVLSLYPWGQYVLGPNTTRKEVTMYDALDQGFEQVDELAAEVTEHLNDGEKVLVHCQAGLNRSGLLAARTLTLWQGISGVEAISILRETRSPLVLCNEAFESWIGGIK